MLWTFCRKGRYLHCEIRLPLQGPGYEMVIQDPNGSERVEKFENSVSLNQRALQVQQQLRVDGWLDCRPPRAELRPL